MERYRRIYREMISLLSNSRTVDPKFLGYQVTFPTKVAGFEIMHHNTLQKSEELERVAMKEKGEDRILLEGTQKAWNEAVAYFEAYLNALYSLLQIVAKVTLCYYRREVKIGQPYGDNFGFLIDFLEKHPKIDPEFSSYVTGKLRWYKTLRNNRHMITHEGAAFLGFEKDGKIVFIDYPRKGFSWFQQNKANRQLKQYLISNLSDLFEFLEFYANHFRQKVKSL